MHLGVIFETVGGYHAARLSAARTACDEKGWRFTAIEITNAQGQHPWGDVENRGFEMETVLPLADAARSLTADEQAMAAKRVPNVLDSYAFDALAICGWGFAYSQAALKWCKRRNAGAILMSESKFDDAPRTWWKEAIKSWRYARRFDAALVGGTRHRHYLETLGMSKARIFTGYDVVDNEYFARNSARARTDSIATRSRQPRIPARPYILSATRFIGRKNILGLIEAYASYTREIGADCAWDLVVCGSGEDEHAIRLLIRKLGMVDRVHLPGFVTYRDIPDWYGLASAFIHPAMHEQWGLVVNEAMASGLPVLVSDRCGCFPELVQHGVTGLGFDPASVAAMKDALVRVTLDRELREAMAASAARHVGNFSKEHFGRGLVTAAMAATAVK